MTATGNEDEVQMSIEVIDESGHGLDVRRLQRLCATVLEAMRVHPQAELCLTAVDEDTMAELNGRWMDKDGPTDVLAFPMDELRPGLVNEEPEEGVLGDLVLCPAVAQRQAATERESGREDHDTTAELDMLTVHGLLHLLGYDHGEPEEHAEMFGLQGELLTRWQHSAEVPLGRDQERA